MVEIRKPFTDVGITRRPVVTINNEKSMTKQSMSKELDVNNIIKKYNKTGILQQAHQFEGVYGDFNSYDLQEAIQKVDKANELFMEVPSEVRAKFNNDAGAFIDFATDAANLDQMREWGLAKPKPQEEFDPPPKDHENPPTEDTPVPPGK